MLAPSRPSAIWMYGALRSADVASERGGLVARIEAPSCLPSPSQSTIVSGTTNVAYRSARCRQEGCPVGEGQLPAGGVAFVIDVKLPAYGPR